MSWWSFEYSWNSKPLGQPWQSIALALVGIVCSAGTFFSYANTRAFINSAVETTGTVVDLVRHGDTYSPIIAFYDEELHRHTFASSTSSSRPRFDINEPVTVLYPPDAPDKARIGGIWNLWLLTGITGILGVTFSFASVLLWIYRRPFYTLAGFPNLSGPGPPADKKA